MNIDDLAVCEPLGEAQMRTVKGGFDPFAHLNLTGLLNTIPGYESAPDSWKPETDAIGSLGESINLTEGIMIEDSNHTEITSSYPG